ncbi:MAG: hypothetical protein R3E09_11290 [Novosphingobium sp.]
MSGPICGQHRHQVHHRLEGEALSVVFEHEQLAAGLSTGERFQPSTGLGTEQKGVQLR